VAPFKIDGVSFSGEGISGKRSLGHRREWKLRSEMRSPAWTTNIAEVPTVLAR
jgi:hypothetical protein